MNRILVTGSGGLLGSRLVPVLSENYEVMPSHNMHAIHSNSVRMDIVDKGMVSKIISDLRPNVIVHAAAETNVDKCENSKKFAWSVNVEGTRNIAESCASVGARLIYVSTDYVFDGDKGFYTESDSPNPVNYYGLTKLKGEESVRHICKDFVIARPSVLYGWHPRKLNFATWVIDSLRRGRKISVVEDHFNSPTLADNLAEMILRIVEKDLRGIYHTAGEERINRYEFAIKAAKAFELDESLITPLRMGELKVWKARRPRDSSLSVEKVRQQTFVKPVSVCEGLRTMKNGEEATMRSSVSGR